MISYLWTTRPFVWTIATIKEHAPFQDSASVSEAGVVNLVQRLPVKTMTSVADEATVYRSRRANVKKAGEAQTVPLQTATNGTTATEMVSALNATFAPVALISVTRVLTATTVGRTSV